MKIWDLIEDASFKKKDLIKNSDSPELAEKLYEPFLVNKAFSQYPDTIFAANEMNQNFGFDKYLQYTYYLHRLPSRKRFSKWNKKPKEEYFEFVSAYFKTGKKETEEIIRILPKEKLEEIKGRFVDIK